MGKAQTEREFKADFLGRTAAARKLRFKNQTLIGEALGFGTGAEAQSKYGKYESRTELPHHLIKRFCLICGVTVDWLVTGEGAGPVWQAVREEEKTSRSTTKKRRAA